MPMSTSSDPSSPELQDFAKKLFDSWQAQMSSFASSPDVVKFYQQASEQFYKNVQPAQPTTTQATPSGAEAFAAASPQLLLELLRTMDELKFKLALLERRFDSWESLLADRTEPRKSKRKSPAAASTRPAHRSKK